MTPRMSTPDAHKPKQLDTINGAENGEDPCGACDGEDTATKQFSPFAGCSIFLIAGLIAAGMVAFLIWSYFQERDRIEGFTDEKPKVIQIEQTADQEVTQVALKSKLLGFRHNIEAKHGDKITLNTEEMNLAIATFEILKPLKGTLQVTHIGNGSIEAEISFATKSRMRSDTKRYINATLTIQPELVDGAAFPKITNIQTDNGATIPNEHQKLISESLLKALYDDKELGPVFRGLSSVEINNNTLILHTDPQYEAEETTPANSTELVIDRLLKGFAIIAVIFLTIVTLIIILSRRKNNLS